MIKHLWIWLGLGIAAIFGIVVWIAQKNGVGAVPSSSAPSSGVGISVSTNGGSISLSADGALGNGGTVGIDANIDE